MLRLVGMPDRRELDRERGSAASRGYDRTWQRLRASVLNEDPLCHFCLAEGRTTAATVVDHIERIRDRPDLRLVRSNLRPLCKPHHDAHTARTEARPAPAEHGASRTRSGV